MPMPSQVGRGARGVVEICLHPRRGRDYPKHLEEANRCCIFQLSPYWMRSGQ